MDQKGMAPLVIVAIVVVVAVVAGIGIYATTRGGGGSGGGGGGGQEPWSYKTESLSFITSAALSTDGMYIAGGFLDKVCLFNRLENNPLWEYRTEAGVSSIAISSDDNYIVVGIYGEVYLFNKNDNAPLWFYQTRTGVNAVAISENGDYIAVASDKIYLFERSSNIPIWTYQLSADTVAISSDGNYLVAESGEKIYLFTGTPIISMAIQATSVDQVRHLLWTYQAQRGGAGFIPAGISNLHIASDGSYIIAVCGCSDFYSNLCLFRKESNTPVWSYQLYQYTSGGYVGDVWASSVAISPNGSYIALGSLNSEVYIFSKENNIPTGNYWMRSNVNSVAVSSDGYVAAGAGLKVCLLNSSGALIWSHEIDDAGIEGVIFSGDGRYLLVQGLETLRLFDRTQLIS